MKIIYLAIILLIPTTTEASQKYDTSKLNPCLKNLYFRLVKKEDLIDETHTCNLELKFANKKWFLFKDGYVRLDSTTRYSFVKVKKIVELPDNINDFKKIRITFKIIATNVSLNSAEWPALEVEIVKLTLTKSSGGTP